MKSGNLTVSDARLKKHSKTFNKSQTMAVQVKR